MGILSRELFNLLGRGGIARLRLLGLGQLKGLKEYGLQLLRRVKVEFIVTGKLTGGTLLFGDLLYEGILCVSRMSTSTAMPVASMRAKMVTRGSSKSV